MGALLIVSLSLGMNNFAGSIAIGLAGVNARLRVRIAVIFGIFEAGMPVIGLLLGQSMAGDLGVWGKRVGAGLLVLMGIYYLIQSRRNEAEDIPRDSRLGPLLLAGLALSIDNLVVGFALGIYHLPILLAVVTIAAVSASMALIGLEIGSRLGSGAGPWGEVLGGVGLIGVGAALGSGLLG